MKPRGNKARAAITVAIVLSGASIALASADRRYVGQLDDEGSVALSLDRGKAPKVRRIEIANISVDCGKDGSGRFNFRVKGSAPVRDNRTFVVRSRDGTGGRARLSGRFTRDYAAAAGKARVRGEFNNSAGGGSATCDSGKQKYVAR